MLGLKIDGESFVKDEDNKVAVEEEIKIVSYSG